MTREKQQVPYIVAFIVNRILSQVETVFHKEVNGFDWQRNLIYTDIVYKIHNLYLTRL